MHKKQKAMFAHSRGSQEPDVRVANYAFPGGGRCRRRMRRLIRYSFSRSENLPKHTQLNIMFYIRIAKNATRWIFAQFDKEISIS